MSTALVTGGTGFIGLYVVKLLLERGHVVHTTVRNLKDSRKNSPLMDLQAKHPGKLQLFQADLLKDGSFSQAMQGCDIVYHVASPFLVPEQIKDGLKDCVEPALQGTRTVLDSVNRTNSVKRVVLTSSIAAMYGDGAEVLQYKNGTLSEAYWNENSSVTNSPYSYSKVAAEREGWKMCEAQNRWDLVVINPGLVVGPSLSPDSASGSLYMLEAMYRGENKYGTPDVQLPLADVREVAEAHVKVGESPTAKGRYIIASERSVGLLEMANCVRPIHSEPNLLPTRNLPKMMIYAVGPFMGLTWKWVAGNIGIAYKVDNDRSVKELGINYGPMEEVLRDHYRAWLKIQSAI